jgi:uncharacterized RDD family membrane protein YckC
MRDEQGDDQHDAPAPGSARIQLPADGADTERSPGTGEGVVEGAAAETASARATSDLSAAVAAALGPDSAPLMLGEQPSGPSAASDAAGVAAPIASAALRVTAASVGGVTPRAGSVTAGPGRRRDAQTVVVVGFWRRLGAALVDLAVITPAALLAIWIAGKLTGVRVPTGLDFWLDLVLASDPALMMAVGLTIAVAAFYVLVFQILHARTLGMRLLRMRVIDVYGDPPSPARCVARTLGYVGSAFTLLLGFLWIGFDREKRGLHDFIAGTYVIRS